MRVHHQNGNRSPAETPGLALSLLLASSFACAFACSSGCSFACSGNPSSSGTKGRGQVQPAAVPTSPTGWRHKRSTVTAALGSARHAAIDAIVNPGVATDVEGKFAYGKVSKDLQDEWVWLLLSRSPSAGPEAAGQPSDETSISAALTDSDGRSTIMVPGGELRSLGAYAYRFLVGGDLSDARGIIWVVARGQKVVVFDIDGTLTTGDSELIDDAFGGDIDVRAGAVDVVRHWYDAGHLPVYLTGRPYMYNAATRAWLAQHGFPPGPMATANSLSEAVPSRGGVGAFKRAWLRALVETTGVEIAAAYGNAATDICAFAEVGIPPAKTYIIDNDQPACEGHDPINSIADYPGHLETLRAPTQP